MGTSYWLCLFTGKTWDEFVASGSHTVGFRDLRWTSAKRIHPPDVLLCYVTLVSRWIGALEVLDDAYWDETPIWSDDVFPARIPVKPLVQLAPENSIPVRDLSDKLTYFKRGANPNSWRGHFLQAPRVERPENATAVVDALRAAETHPHSNPVKPTLWNKPAPK